jgi:hypothetical protein
MFAVIAASLMSLLTGVTTTASPTPRAERVADPLFPANGRLTLSTGTGAPVVAVAELAYGFGDRFALGALAGVTGDATLALGLRPRLVVFQHEGLRAVALLPLIYYPDADPWVLANPTLRLEIEVGAVRVHAGMGAYLAACTESIGLALGVGRPQEDENGDGEWDGFMGGAWNTVSLGAAMALRPDLDVFVDVNAVMSGLRPATDWLGGVPVTAVLGLSARL